MDSDIRQLKYLLKKEINVKTMNSMNLLVNRVTTQYKHDPRRFNPLRISEFLLLIYFYERRITKRLSEIR